MSWAVPGAKGSVNQQQKDPFMSMDKDDNSFLQFQFAWL